MRYLLALLLLTSCGNEQSDTGTNERQETGLQQPILGDDPRVVPPSNPQCKEERLYPKDLSGVCVPLMPTMGALQVE